MRLITYETFYSYNIHEVIELHVRYTTVDGRHNLAVSNTAVALGERDREML